MAGPGRFAVCLGVSVLTHALALAIAGARPSTPPVRPRAQVIRIALVGGGGHGGDPGPEREPEPAPAPPPPPAPAAPRPKPRARAIARATPSPQPAARPLDTGDPVALPPAVSGNGGGGVGGGSGGGEGRGRGPGVGEARVAYGSNPLPPYPLAARRLGMEGVVLLEVVVAPDGHATDVRVVRSSGHPPLDESAVRTVSTSWRFIPGRRDGEPVESRATVPIRFKLTDAPHG